MSRGENVINILDPKDSALYREGYPDRRALVDLDGARSSMAVALRQDGNLLGLVNIDRQEVKPFDERWVSILQSFTEQAVTAMTSATTLGELRQRTSDLQESLEQQTALADVLRVISLSTFDLRPVLATLLETVAHLCCADYSMISTREGDAYRCVASHSAFPAFNEAYLGRLFPVDRGNLTGRTVVEAAIVHLEDIAADLEMIVRDGATLGAGAHLSACRCYATARQSA